jgi:hypothetical protein
VTVTTSATDPLVARLGVLLARLEPQEHEPCRVPGCVHEDGHGRRGRPLAA